MKIYVKKRIGYKKQGINAITLEKEAWIKTHG